MAIIKRGIGKIISIVPEQDVKEEDVKKALLVEKIARESLQERLEKISSEKNK